MLKERTLRLYPCSAPCDMGTVIALLKKAGWSVTDHDGNIHFWSTATDEWEVYRGSFDEFAAEKGCIFHAYNEGQCVSVAVDGGDSFDILPAPEYTLVGENRVFDFNRCYDRFVNRMNEGKCVIERVIFEEY